MFKSKPGDLDVNVTELRVQHKDYITTARLTPPPRLGICTSNTDGSLGTFTFHSTWAGGHSHAPVYRHRGETHS